MRWPIYFVAVLLLVVAGLLAANRAEESPRPTPVDTAASTGMEESACPAGTVGRVTCMFVEVPENYADPEIKSIRLFVARLAPPLEAVGDPIVFIGDGLGTSSVGDFGEWQQVSRSTGRDVILVDLRASGRSEPSMACPETRSVGWLESDLSAASLDSVRREFDAALADCRERLARSIPMDAYSLQSIVRDLDVIRNRLDIERWSLFGVGDAAMVARAYEQQLPDVVSSLILVGAAPTSADRGPNRYRYANEVLDAVLTDELEEDLATGLDPLQRRSFVFSVSGRGRTQRVAVSRETVRPILAGAAGDPDLVDAIPNLITERLADEQWRSFAVLRAQQSPGESRSLGPVLNVVCGEPTAVGVPPLPEAVDDFDTEWTGLLDDHSLHPEFCETWDATPHATVERAPGAPTLVVNGEYDLTAPASAAEVIAASWSDATTLVLPRSGPPSPFDACVTAAVAEFLKGGTPTLDTTCS